MLINKPPRKFPLSTAKPSPLSQPDMANEMPLAITNKDPLALARMRFCLTPTHISAAPSRAHAAAVQRASKARGIVIVPNATAIARNASTSNRNWPPLARNNAFAVTAYRSATVAALMANPYSKSSTRRDCSAKAITGVPKTNVPSTTPLSSGGCRDANKIAIAR